MGAPVGPTGCEGEKAGGSWFVGAAGGATRSRLLFDGDRHYDFEQQAITGFVGYQLASGWSLRGAAGAIAGGELDGDELPGSFDMGPGVVGSISGSRRWALGDGNWFVTGSGTFAVGATTTEPTNGGDSDRFTAFDLRVGAIAGRTFADRVSPYLLARGFGGPVMWTIAGESATGTDTRHFQLGAGVSVATKSGLAAVVDVSALGEQSVSLGLSWQL